MGPVRRARPRWLGVWCRSGGARMLREGQGGRETSCFSLTEVLSVDGSDEEVGFRGESCPLRALQGRGGGCSWELFAAGVVTVAWRLGVRAPL